MKTITKSITILFIISFLFVESSCSKSNGIDSSTTNQVNHDSTLLFALNISQNSFSDTSVYKNSPLVNNTNYRIRPKNGVNYLELGHDFNSTSISTDPNAIFYGYNQISSPNLTSMLPAGKVIGNITVFFELMNSTNNSNTLNLKDSTENSIIANFGIPANNQTRLNNPINFYYTYQKNRNPIWWGRRLDWHNFTNPCQLAGSGIEGYSNYSGSMTANKPLSISSTIKMVFVINGNVAKIYLDGILLDSQTSNGNITLNGCSLFTYGITISVLRGTLLKNLKVWNRGLNESEIATL